MVETQKYGSQLPGDPQGSQGIEGSVPQNTVLENRWRIVGVAGAGGMASVYKARDLRFPNVTRYVAVKQMFNVASDPQIREMTVRIFEREADILASLSHPAIPKIHDYFPKGDHVYVVMEYINGKDLEALLNSVSELPVEMVYKWAIELCDVLSYLHNHQPEPIMFRDVKPSNIMVDQHGNVRLVDFGIAKPFQVGAKGTMIGTEGYSAPEQYKGEATPLSDIYGIGATLHHILTRRDPRLEPPFSFAERPVRQYNPKVPPEFEAIIMQAVSYNAADRPQSAKEMKEALEKREVKPQPGSASVSSPSRDNAVEEDGFEVGGSTVVPIWAFRCEDEIRSSPVVYGGAVYVGAYDNNLYAVQANDGAFKWKFDTEGGIAARPEIDPDSNHIIFGSEDGTVYAIDLQGRIAWTIMTEHPVRCTARVALGHVFVGNDDGILYAAKVTNGNVIWKYDAGAPIRSRPWVTDERVIFGSEIGAVTALDLASTFKWRFNARRGVTSSPTVYDGLAYFGSNDWHVYAIDVNTGFSAWRHRTQKPVISTPAIDPTTKNLFVGSVDGNMYALDIESGKERWRFTAEDQITSSPATANGAVYFGSVDGNIYCVDAKTGKLRWSFTTEAPVVSSPFIHENIVYVGSSDHHLYALSV